MPPDTHYYDILGLTPQATETEIKKAYRRLAVDLYPDKDPSTDAKTKLQQIGNAYQILSDPDLRARYDDDGVDLISDDRVYDMVELFTALLRRLPFKHLVGEIRLIAYSADLADVTSTLPDLSPGKSDESTPALTSEQQKQKLAQLEQAEKAAGVERVEQLQRKLIDRIEPFVHARQLGETDGNDNDEETAMFVQSIRAEVERLRLESFGVELLHSIGYIYTAKATTFLQSRQFLGGGLLGYVKQKGTLFKEYLGLAVSNIDTYGSLNVATKRMADRRASMEQVSQDVKVATYKIEILRVLSDVLDEVLAKRPDVSDEILDLRAEAIIAVGAIFCAVEPDESDDERREIDRLVAQCLRSPKKNKKQIEEKAAMEMEALEKGDGPRLVETSLSEPDMTSTSTSTPTAALCTSARPTPIESDSSAATSTT